MPKWQPGTSGNPKGRPRKRNFDVRLRHVLAANKAEVAKELVAALVQKAKTGDVAALKLIAERTGGKAAPAEPQQPAEPPVPREEQRARLLDLLRSPELKSLVEEALKPTERVQ